MFQSSIHLFALFENCVKTIHGSLKISIWFITYQNCALCIFFTRKKNLQHPKLLPYESLKLIWVNIIYCVFPLHAAYWWSLASCPEPGPWRWLHGRSEGGLGGGVWSRTVGDDGRLQQCRSWTSEKCLSYTLITVTYWWKGWLLKDFFSGLHYKWNNLMPVNSYYLGYLYK